MGVYRNTITDLECVMSDDAAKVFPEGVYVYVGPSLSEEEELARLELHRSKVTTDETDPFPSDLEQPSLLDPLPLEHTPDVETYTYDYETEEPSDG